jgi:hypothetical protein
MPDIIIFWPEKIYLKTIYSNPLFIYYISCRSCSTLLGKARAKEPESSELLAINIYKALILFLCWIMPKLGFLQDSQTILIEDSKQSAIRFKEAFIIKILRDTGAKLAPEICSG